MVAASPAGNKTHWRLLEALRIADDVLEVADQTTEELAGMCTLGVASYQLRANGNCLPGSTIECPFNIEFSSAGS